MPETTATFRTQAGFSLDKINSVKAQIRGDFGAGFNVPSITPATLSYGGTTYLRPVKVGLPESGRPDRLVGEILPFETFKYNAGSSFPPSEIDPADNVIDDVLSIALSNQPTASANIEPSGSFLSDKLADRSVAAADWKIEFFAKKGFFNLPLDQVDDIIIYIDHRYADRSTAGVPNCVSATAP